MKILILAAMEKEIDLLLNLIDQPEIIVNSENKYWKGEIGNHTVFISRCGIGKVNSAINTLIGLQIFKPDLVINSGVAGGAGTPIGSVIVANRVSYHDVWCGPGTKYGQAEGLPLFMIPSKDVLELAATFHIKTGLICSGDKFISTPEQISEIRSNFPDVMAVDMESASIAQTCILNKIEFAIIRVVSDTPGEGENISQYKDFWETAPIKTFEVIKQLFQSLK